MATQASVQAHVSHGFAKAAAVLGATCNTYRPTGANNPLTTVHATLPVLFDTNADMKQRQPSRDIKLDDWYVGCDFSQVQAGDYVVDPNYGTFYFAAVEFFRAARVVRCNKVGTISKAGLPATVEGLDTTYNSDVAATESILAVGWPFGFEPGTKGERGDSNLPGDVRQPWYTILLPPSLPVALRNTFILTATTGERYILSSTVSTPLGWRCTAILAST